ncbi:hypothetical protein F383_25269 [Gossypium arboreum]|uniref:Uncharacterized protein n=1 Tax=Gossypium arboreum TaxID=29729 RepID=A0A0B0P459_GOSAR|nr:hypothetical protein F383_25269 [Gossypium arboreum]
MLNTIEVYKCVWMIDGDQRLGK